MTNLRFAYNGAVSGADGVPRKRGTMAPAQRDETARPIQAEDLTDMASIELEKMRLNPHSGDPQYHNFPPACLTLLKSMSGNAQCIDCSEHDPQWATVSYGALLCLNCSGRHRSLGVQVSCVRSVSMDNWSNSEVLAMLEGGNAQLREFYERHHLCESTPVKIVERIQKQMGNVKLISDDVTNLRYKTKAAQFYRQQMSLHVAKILESGEYKGRDVSRRKRYIVQRDLNVV